MNRNEEMIVMMMVCMCRNFLVFRRLGIKKRYLVPETSVAAYLRVICILEVDNARFQMKAYQKIPSSSSKQFFEQVKKQVKFLV